MAHHFEAHVESAGDGLVRVVTTGEVDLATSELLLRIITDALSHADMGRIQAMEIDLSGVTLLAASGIGVLLAAQQQVADRGIRLQVRGIAGLPLQALEITGTLKQLGGRPDHEHPPRTRRAPQ